MPGTRVFTCSAKRVVVTVGNFFAGDVAVCSISGVFVDMTCAVSVRIGNSVSIEIAGAQATKIKIPIAQTARMILLFHTMDSPMNDDP